MIDIAKLERAFEKESKELIERIRIGREISEDEFAEQIKGLLSDEQREKVNDWLIGKHLRK